MIYINNCELCGDIGWIVVNQTQASPQGEQEQCPLCGCRAHIAEMTKKIDDDLDRLKAENTAKLAELTAISDALGTREGHSSVRHIEALKAEVRLFREEFEKICSKVIDSPYIYAGKNYTLHDLRHGVEQAFKAENERLTEKANAYDNLVIVAERKVAEAEATASRYREAAKGMNAHAEQALKASE